ncbi:Uncharacterised protein [Neisseria meningitidis]|nr:Uncharacterised protein [Neisseria meningitidis]CWN81685.1 Uncharacterised protein [Neisseria meningitidis]CWP09604.1 Uncharacterised protein [Neisseria meningitidis]CWR21556.1 Uncharacterised protein [Neisseria meningitidis]CWR43516.1 Uncharacterised protein [Neisseria meningitidis]
MLEHFSVGFIGAVGEIAAEVVVVVGYALPDAAGVGRIEFDTAGCAVDVIGVFVSCARRFGVIAALRAVVGIGGMMFVSFPVEPVHGKAFVNVALFFACAVGGVVVEGGVFFVSVSGKADGVTKIALDCRLLDEQVAHLVGIVLDDVDLTGAVGDAAARVAEEVVFAAGFVVLPLGVIGNERVLRQVRCEGGLSEGGGRYGAGGKEVCQSAQRFHGLSSFAAADDFVADIGVFTVVLFEVGTVLGGCVAVGGNVGEIDHQAV